MKRDDLNARLLRTFIVELEEQVGAMNDALLKLEQAPGDEDARKGLFRASHTIKGAARILGLDPIENVCHVLEDYYAAVRDGRAALDAERFQLLFRAADALADAQQRLASGESLEGGSIGSVEPELRALARSLAPPPGRAAPRQRDAPSGVLPRGAGAPLPRAPQAGTGAPPGPARVPSAPAAEGPLSEQPPDDAAGQGRATGGTADPDAAEIGGSSGVPATGDAEGLGDAEDAEDARDSGDAAPAEPTAAADMVRVDAARLELLHGSAGDLMIAATRLDERIADFDALRQSLDGWISERRRDVQRVAAGGAAIPSGAGGTDRPGAGVRGTRDGLDARIERLRTGMVQLERALREDARAVRRASDTVGADIRGLRLRPVADAFQALPRAVRDVAAGAGKQVRLELDGGDVQADRLVVDALREPLLHVVRNAIDHGIESPEARVRAGKDATGTVRVAATHSEGRVVVTVDDDGRGLDGGLLRRRFEERGLPAPQSDRDLARTLLTSGVSSRGVATEISGRGVGLDVVRAGLERIRGNVNVRWKEGAGTRFILESPPSPSMLRAVLVHCGNQVLALPDIHVQRLLRVRPADVRQSEGRSVILGADGPIPLAPLATLLGPPLAPPRNEGMLDVVVIEVADRQLAVIVDALEAEQEIVVRPLEGAAARIRYIGGGALLPSGRVALVVHMPRLVAAGVNTDAGAAIRAAEAANRQRQRILVADDSITTRTLEQSLLEAAGYDVITAVDGLDAWRRLQEEGADLVVADVEMPRMDGFSLCETIRRSQRFAALPVILVTGLEAPEHRARGLAAGADAYLPKSAFDQEQLLQTIRELLD